MEEVRRREKRRQMKTRGNKEPSQGSDMKKMKKR